MGYYDILHISWWSPDFFHQQHPRGKVDNGNIEIADNNPIWLPNAVRQVQAVLLLQELRAPPSARVSKYFLQKHKIQKTLSFNT